MLKKWLKTAAILSLLAASFGTAAQAAPSAQGGALQELLSGTVIDGLDAIPSPEELTVPMPVQEKATGGGVDFAPAPGRDFTPTIYDAARIKAIMKLVTDIHYGNHLPYSQDGAKFKNKEGKLPAKEYGYYREYTLLTGSAPHTVKIGDKVYNVAPDLSARGSERLIIGGGEKIYYTPDHYKTFILLTVVY